jgi:MFS family permease
MAVTRSTVQAAAAAAARRGVTLGALATFLSVTAASVSFPFLTARRDALGCDALCQGGQTSLRSALTLVGATLIGRASDRFGRIPMLWLGLFASLVALSIHRSMDTIQGMWLAIVPSALLNQTFSVMKATFSDYIQTTGGTEADRAGAIGRLGMAVGLSFMAGPLLGTWLASDYAQSLKLSAAMYAMYGAVLYFLPAPAAGGRSPNADGGGGCGGITAFARLPVLRERGVQMLMALRLAMALAFHMYAPIWQVSLKSRFNFGPSDHARFMGVIGGTYALSQGFLARMLVEASARHPTALVLGCIFSLGGARPFAFWTSSVEVVYILYVPMVVALGVMNTAIATATTRLAGKDQVGGLFGLLESVESVAGMVGPSVGGLISRSRGANATLIAVCGCYASAFALVVAFGHLLWPSAKKSQRKAD